MDDEQLDLEAILNDHVGDVMKCNFTRDIEWIEVNYGMDKEKK
jgi:hypothetical protein